VLVTAATVDYLRERRRLTRRTRRVAGGVALLGAAGVTVGGVLLEQALTGIAGGAALLVLGAALAVE
jgi:Tfp pilus assembly protein PilN